jgi:hypothetical protein
LPSRGRDLKASHTKEVPTQDDREQQAQEGEEQDTQEQA